MGLKQAIVAAALLCVPACNEAGDSNTPPPDEQQLLQEIRRENAAYSVLISTQTRIFESIKAIKRAQIDEIRTESSQKVLDILNGGIDRRECEVVDLVRRFINKNPETVSDAKGNLNAEVQKALRAAEDLCGTLDHEQ